MKSIILVGGEGTRLRPITYLNPKPMLPLINRPFIHNFILWLKSHGLKDIIFSTCYLPEIFTDYFGDGSWLGLKLTYVKEESPLGTCGAVKNVEKYLGNEPFLVFNGDILTSLNLKEMIDFHKKNKADITIALTPVDDPTAYGLVPLDADGRVKEFLEKPSPEEITTNLINAGTYVMESHMLKLAPEGENYSFERGLFPKALEQGYNVFGFVSNSYWLDVGTPEKYLMANHDILERKLAFNFEGMELLSEVFLGENAKAARENFASGPVVIGENTEISKGAKIYPQTVIGKNCRIGEDSRITGCVIFNDCRIGRGCILENSIISNNVEISDNVRIEGISVIGDNSRVGSSNILKNGIKININSDIKDKQIFF